MFEAGLVLEGGGMKGLYTAGVLDFFLDKSIEFSSVYGVSAGACTMCSYLSKQRGRGFETMTDYLDQKRYMGIYSLLTTGDIFGAEMSYNLVPNYLNPFDYEEYKKYEGKAYAVVTNIETGKAEYIQIKDMKEGIQYVRASSSLPLVSRNVEIDGKLYLDGGIADSIPIKKSEADGNRKNIVVMTKAVGYKREPEKTVALLKAKYRKYPHVYELMENRHIDYNKTVAYIEEEEKSGKLLLLRPEKELEIGRLEKDKEKLRKLYDAGYEETAARYDEIMSYLNS